MKRSHIVIIHLLFWLIIVIIPFSLTNFKGHFEEESYYFLFQHLLNALLFYLTYLLLIPFIFRRLSLKKAIITGLVYILFMSLLRFLISPAIREFTGAFERFPPNLGMRIFYAINWTVLFTIYPLIIYLSIEWYKERNSRFELMKERKQGEIDLLKSQVNPHFLMNTLNNLYSLVYQGSSNASDAVLKLSDLMRYMLYDTQTEFVSLENEIKYLKSFIELQMLRFTNKELVKFEIDGDPTGKLIVPMLLVPFVENAFKHGNKNLNGLGISIKMTIEDNQMTFEVGNHKASQTAEKISDSGIGLSNIRMRLEHQYPGKHELLIDDSPQKFEVRLTLSL
jgi:two-component system, LytTR family, sensor kinase